MSVCHPGAGGLGRDGGPHQGDQRPNTGRAEENHLGGAGPAVGKHRYTQQPVHVALNTVKDKKPSISCFSAFIFMMKLKNVSVEIVK